MELEDARKKLQFSDSLVQCRCITRLKNAVLKKKPPNKPLSSETIQVPELNLLWETCGSDCFAVATLAANTIVSLVFDGHVDFEYAVNKFLNIASSSSESRKLVAVVCGVTKLLIHCMANNKDSSGSPYSLQYPKHPFIAVLESQPGSWPIVLQSIVDVALGKNKREHGFQIMEPVVTYILFNPCNTPETMMLRSALISHLTMAGEKYPTAVLKYLCEVLPWMQVSSFEEVAGLTSLISQMSHLLVYCEKKDDIQNILELYIFCALSLITHCIKFGVDPSLALEVAEDMSYHLLSDQKLSMHISACYVLISILIKETSAFTLQKLLNICATLLEKQPPTAIFAALLIVPVIQLMSEPNIIVVEDNEKDRELLPCFLAKLESIMHNSQEHNVTVNGSAPTMFPFEAFSSSTSHALLCANFLCQLENFDDSYKLKWMSHMKEMISRSGHVSNFQFHIVASIFLISESNQELLSNCLMLLEVICETNNVLSTNMFAILLYKQSSLRDPRCLQLVMDYFPKTATHKYAVGPVLNIIQMMACHSALKPQAVYLMLQLWKRQERCFPYLEKLLVEKDPTVDADTGVCEVRIAQALAIKDICTEEPQKYGNEFLQPLSTMINESHSEASTPAALLALDAIYHLCKFQALDLRSTWKILAPKLGKDKRSSITVRICKLLSLAPELQVKSFQYDKFMNELASYLWKMLSWSTVTPDVIGAAYEALSLFPFECHNLRQLPAIAKVNLKLPPSMASTPFEMAKSPEDVLTYIPGYCFVDILKNTEKLEALDGYEHFLQSVVKQEVTDLPRGVYIQRKRIGKKRDASDVLSNIPGILCTQFEVQKSATNRKNLAVGILLSYEPPVEHDKEGKPLKRSLAMHLRLFEQILTILLNEVNLDCNEWQRCVLLPHSWAAFMERAFFACEESRIAELELQRSHGHLKGSEEEISMFFNTAWLWVRDRLLDLIKFVAKTSSQTAANSVFAISGLVRAVEKFHSGLEDKTKKLVSSYEKYASHDEFVLLCTESILSILDSQYVPSSKILGWLVSPSSKHSSSASSLIKGCAGASLCNLQSVLKKSLPNKIPHFCDILLQNLLQDSSLTLSMYTGVGFGFFFQSLCQAGYGDEQVNYLLELALKLEAMCKEDLKCGNFIALTITAISMSQNGNPTFLQHVSSMCHEFHQKLMYETTNSMVYDFLSICTSCMMVSAASANIINLKEIVELSSWFCEKVKDVPQCSKSAVSLGILLDSLLHLGYAKAEEQMDNVRKTWLRTLASEKEPTLHRLAALNGMSSLFSSGRGLIKLSKNLSSGSKMASLKELIQLMIQLLNATRDSSLQNVCSWELGRLYAVNVGEPNDADTAPGSYSYLSERSILKPLVQFILDYAENDGNINQIQLALKVLSQNFGRPLPPLNWIAVLTPVIQKESSLVEISMKIAMNQMASSTSALGFVSSYATPPVLYSLPGDCLMLLLKNMPILASHLPPTKFQLFLNASVIPMASETDELFQERGSVALQAMLQTLKQLNSNKTVTETLEDSLYRFLLDLSRNVNIFRNNMHLICELITKLKEESQSSLKQDLESSGNLSLTVFIQCHMVENGMQPLISLRHYVESAKYASQEDKETIIRAVLECFYVGSSVPKSDIHEPKNCIAFLMETIGWIKVLTDSDSKYQLTSATQAASFLFDLCLAIIVGASGHEVCYALWPEESVKHKSLIEALPSALFMLMENQTWEKSTDKIINWLSQMKWSPFLHNSDECFIQAALCALRFSKHFQNMSVWCEIINPPLLNI